MPRKKKEPKYEQLSFLSNGNISPCPYRKECKNHPAGCSGHSYWCNRDELFEKKLNK